MAQSALTVTPPNPTPPTNLSSIGMTPPDPLLYLANVYAFPFGNPPGSSPFGQNPNPPPLFDDGVANTYPVISQNEGGGVNGTTVPAVVGNGKVFAAAHAVVADSTGAASAAAEGAGTELAVTATVPNPSPAGQLVMVSTGPVQTAASLAAGPNASHASTLSGSATPTLSGATGASNVSGVGTTVLTVTGTNFNRASVVNISGVPQTTNYVSATSLTVDKAMKRTTAGTLPVTVTSNGQTTAPVNWTLT
jgi:hypothetical protein